MWKEVSNSPFIHIHLLYSPMWSNVSKSTFFHIITAGDQRGKMCPNPHFSTFLLRKPNVDKCVQIHIFPHYITAEEPNVDKCVQIPHFSTFYYYSEIMWIVSKSTFWPHYYGRTNKCVQIPHLSTFYYLLLQMGQMCPNSTSVHIILFTLKMWTNVSNFHILSTLYYLLLKCG